MRRSARLLLPIPVFVLLLAAVASAREPFFPRAPSLRIQEWLQGSPTSLEDLRGRVVLLEFFQIVCPPCEAVRPEIEALQARYQEQGLQVLGLAVAFQDLENQTPEKIRGYVEDHPFPYPIGLDEALEAPRGELPELRTTFDIYGADASPYVFVIDRKGRLRGGGVYQSDEVEGFLQEILAEPGP